MDSSQPWAGRRLHFVGISGAGMSGLALVARGLGAQVSGSDRNESPYLGPVRAAGIEPVIGEHSAESVPDGAEIVYSTAVPEDNPERAAGRAGAGEIHRGALLGEVTRLRRCLAVTGTHGKTTTAAMAVCALRGAGMDPSYLVGGTLHETGANAGWGAGEWIVVEADESDRSLLELHPEIAILTNAELDHHTTYSSRLDLDATLREFLSRAKTAVVWDRPDLLALAAGADATHAQCLAPFVQAYEVAAPELSAGGSRFEWEGVAVELGVPGHHNARNAAAALTAARLAGADVAQAAAALRGFAGTGRRFEALGKTAAGARVYDDYAHHPTEVEATLRAARTVDPGARLVAVMQPHLYSRTAALTREFGEAIALADLPVITELYPAREHAADWPGVTARRVAEAAADAADGRRVAWMPTYDDAHAFLSEELREGDLVLVLGAGPIDALGRRLVAKEAPA
jgi:UDP-N-acetylmuramate--alanine ligase